MTRLRHWLVIPADGGPGRELGIIGVIAGGDPRAMKKALLVIPGSAVLMVAWTWRFKACCARTASDRQLLHVVGRRSSAPPFRAYQTPLLDKSACLY